MNLTTKNRFDPLSGSVTSICRKKRRLVVLLFALVLAVASCGSPPTDPRAAIPEDALIVVETRDLGKLIRAVAESPRFAEAAEGKPDLRAIDGIEMAVAVTGFETIEQPVTDSNSVLNFRPRFVAVTETRLWNFQVLGFVENELGLFISEAYGGEAKLEISEKHGGRYFIWLGQDGQKAYALVLGSLIIFGNDESALERALATKNGELASIAKRNEVTEQAGLVSGYISKEGIAQLANISGVSMANRASDDAEVQSFVARVLPEVLRNTVTEVRWTSQSVDSGIEDRLTISTVNETGTVLGESMAAAEGGPLGIERFIPDTIVSATRYNLKDPRVAWRAALLTAQRQTDELSGKLLLAFSDSLFEPYGIDNAELFLSSVDTQLITARFDGEGERQVVIAKVKDRASLLNSVAQELRTEKPTEPESGTNLWRSADGDVAMAIAGEVVIIGNPDAVQRSLEAGKRINGTELPASIKAIAASTAAAITIGGDSEIPGRIADVLSAKRSSEAPVIARYTTETRINQKAIERTSVSDFGIIGSIIAQFAAE
ncbi:MAG TPA: hypothetical protein PKE66_02185 [Pyrinomonadaceae bacterium]|nr:hypothetical protein [Pyrinomonadaceae bacterium]